MNRRQFLASLFVGAPAAAVAHKLGWWAKLKEWARVKKIGDFDVAPDGWLSLGGQNVFAAYGVDGGLTGGTYRYRLVGGRIWSTLIVPRSAYSEGFIRLKDATEQFLS